MTLHDLPVHATASIKGINTNHNITTTALQEIGIFKGEKICKLCKNRAHCAIFQMQGCNRIMLHSEFLKLIEVEQITEDI